MSNRKLMDNVPCLILLKSTFFCPFTVDRLLMYMIILQASYYRYEKMIHHLLLHTF